MWSTLSRILMPAVSRLASMSEPLYVRSALGDSVGIRQQFKGARVDRRNSWKNTSE